MNLGHDAVNALERAGFQHLSQNGRAYLERRLQEHAGSPRNGGFNLGGLKDLGYAGLAVAPELADASPSAAKPLASFSTLDDAAFALVQIAYRAAPRTWTEVGDAEMKALDTYPALKQVPVRASDAYPGLDADALAALGLGMAADGMLLTLDVPLGGTSWKDAVDGTPVMSPLGSDGRSPSSAAEETFRKLSADWEGFDHVGVGAAVLPALRDDAIAWRAMRDAWKAGRLHFTAIGAALAQETARATRVRHALKIGASKTQASAKTVVKTAPHDTKEVGMRWMHGAWYAVNAEGQAIEKMFNPPPPPAPNTPAAQGVIQPLSHSNQGSALPKHVTEDWMQGEKAGLKQCRDYMAQGKHVVERNDHNFYVPPGVNVRQYQQGFLAGWNACAHGGLAAQQKHDVAGPPTAALPHASKFGHKPSNRHSTPTTAPAGQQPAGAQDWGQIGFKAGQTAGHYYLGTNVIQPIGKGSQAYYDGYLKGWRATVPPGTPEPKPPK